MVWILDWIVSGNAGRLGIAGGLLKPRPSNSGVGFAAARKGTAGFCYPARLMVCLMVGVGFLFGDCAESAQRYTIIDLGTLGYQNSSGTSINNIGQVAGSSNIWVQGNIWNHAFVINKNGQMIDLGTFVGAPGNSGASGINDKGQVVGDSWATDGWHTFVTNESGQMIDLGYVGGFSTYGINNAGQIVSTRTANGHARAVIINPSGQTIDLGTPIDRESVGYAINDNGQVTGQVRTYNPINDKRHAFVTKSGLMIDLGPSDKESVGFGINNNGQVTGFVESETYGIYHAFFTNSSGEMVDLGVSNGYDNSKGLDINDSGQVVGELFNYPSNSRTAFVTINGSIKVLRSLVDTREYWPYLYTATAINNAGQITGQGYHNGGRHAFLLTPFASEILDPLCTTKTTCTGQDYLVQSGSGLTQDVAKLMAMNVPRDGVAADGATRLVLRIRSDFPVTLTLKPDDNSTPAEQDHCLWGRLESLDGASGSCNTLTVTPQTVPDGGKVAFAVFRAPDGVPQASNITPQVSRKMTIEAKDGSLQILSSQSLTVQTPPAILIHGVWSDPGIWDKPISGEEVGFKRNFSSLGFDVSTVNHSDIEGSAGSFDPVEKSEVFSRVDTAIQQAKYKMRTGDLEQLSSVSVNGFAISQVDVIGHSMGGLIARAYTSAESPRPYFRPDNFGQGDFHKIITIGTPHRGTPLADVLVQNSCKFLYLENCAANGECTRDNIISLKDTFADVLHRPIGPAVLGFQTGSKPIQNIGAALEPSSAIVGIAPESSVIESALDAVISAFRVSGTIDSILGLPPFPENDTIVPYLSQRGGIPVSNRDAAYEVFGVVHAGVKDDPAEIQSRQIFDRLVRLLIEPSNSSKFGHFTSLEPGGSYIDHLAACDYASNTSVKSAQAFTATSAAVSNTISPAPGSVVRPGQNVNLTLDLTGNSPTNRALIVINGEIRLVDGPPPYSITYTVPKNRSGLIPINVLITGTGNYLVNSSLIALPDQTLNQLKVNPKSPYLQRQGETLNLSVLGVFADNSQIDLTAAEAGTTYATQSGNSTVVSVSAAGIVTAKATGQDSIVVSNSGKTATVPVTVNITNHAPVIQIQGGTTVTMAPGEAKTLTVNAIDQEGNAVALSLLDASAFSSFTDQGGGNGSLSLHPLPADVGVHTFHVYALDNGTPALGVTATIQVTVSAANQAPTANAGANLTVRQGSLVTLNGSASTDPDNGPAPLGFAWTKSAGGTVNLIDANTATPKFSAGVAGQYSFSLIVNDGQANSVPASVKVTVPKLGDIDLDGDVDNSDLTRITSTLNKPASSLYDLRDINGDMKLDALDTRKLVLLCTRPRCAVQ